MAQFEKALAVKPDAAAPKLGLGKVHFSKGNVDKALQLFQQIVSSMPGSPEAAEADAFIKALRKAKGPGA
jgi:lipopolysaccharide biosynthesis regulator YciM